MATMMLLIAGVSLYAAAQTLNDFLGWTFLAGDLIAAAVVLFYTWFGGFRATVYTELFHFGLVLLGVVPIFFLVVHQFGGITRLMANIPSARAHAWQGIPFFAPHAVMDRFGLVFGLGLVLSFGFWSTDFVQLQRALAVRRERDAPYVPLSIGFAKLVFAMLVAFTGVTAPLVLTRTGTGANLERHAARSDASLLQIRMAFFRLHGVGGEFDFHVFKQCCGLYFGLGAEHLPAMDSS